MATLIFLLSFLVGFNQLAFSERNHQSSVIAPLSLPPSEYWDGNDGPWSSFWMQIGVPAQNVRLLPGTSATSCNTIWVVIAEGCLAGDSSNCAFLRGSLFNPNQSLTWSTESLQNGGLYNLFAYEEILLGYNGNAFFGYENITLGWQGSGLPMLSHQLVAGIATKDFYLGSLGLSPIPSNFSTFNEPRPSMLQTLRDQSYIPSSSWAYTAGAFYQDPKVFGSLTLGGYDTSRFISNNVTFAFGADSSRDLLVGIQLISSDTTDSPLLSHGIYAFIDSLVPHIWLPIDVCTAFEQAFNLTWDNTTELYLLTKDQHQNLMKQNANLTFKVGPSATSGSFVEIVMPYGALDLINNTQYTLGRAFLQQAYVIADYERSNFSVSQALFPNTSVHQNLIALLPPGVSQSTSHSGLNIGTLAGIIAGMIAVCVFAALVSYLLRCRRRKKQDAVHGVCATPASEEENVHYEEAELDTTEASTPELDTTEASKPELDTTDIGASELDTARTACTNDAVTETLRGEVVSGRQRLQASAVHGVLNGPSYELPAEDVTRPELEGSQPCLSNPAVRR